MSSIPWGTKIWNFFHTLAEKISDKDFLENRINILNLIKESCNYLPCPKCTAHAQNSLKFAKLDCINSKEDLKIFLLQFHNLVNLKNKKKPYPKKDLDKYSTFNFKKTKDDFISVYNFPNRTNNLNSGMRKKLFLENNIYLLDYLTNKIN